MSAYRDGDFGTADGPAHRCGSTVWVYRATNTPSAPLAGDLAAVVVSATCQGCGARYPRAFAYVPGGELTAERVADAHRRHWGAA